MRPFRAAACTLRRRVFSPSNVIVPSWGTKPEIARSVDVLPAPLGPMSATTSPSFTSRSIPRTASTAPYAISTPRSSSIGGGPFVADRRVVLLVDTEVRVDDPLVAEHGARRPHRHEMAELEHGDAVAERRDEVELVIHEEDRHAAFLELAKVPGELVGLGGVQA